MNKIPHNPVLLKEVLAALEPIDQAVFVDATFGAGGYTKALLKEGARKVVAFDRDDSARHYLDLLSNEFPNKVNFINDNFSNMGHHIQEQVDGIVFDVGVSSMQLDQAERGFSFNKEGELDMRMDTKATLTAADVVNSYDEKHLADLLFTYGGEKKSRIIAKNIVKYREDKLFATTTELANVITSSVGYYNDKIHPATRSFQAIRIEVNDELKALTEGIKAASSLLKVGGRMAVVTFHSLEDVIVKRYFNELCKKQDGVNRYMPFVEDGEKSCNFSLINKKVISASLEETSINPRARSAKLRAIRRVA